MNDLDDARARILEHAAHGRHRGVVQPADIDHAARNPLCGDWLRLTLRLDGEGRITALGWDGEGCAISQASASMLSERLIGLTLDEARALPKETVLDLLGIPVSAARLACALLCLEALRVGIHQQTTKGRGP